MISIPVWAYRKSENFFMDILGKAIVYFTGYPYTHVGIYYGGKLYESAVWLDGKKRVRNGIRITPMGDPAVAPPSFCMVPALMPIPFMKRIGEELSRFTVSDRPYGVLKKALVTLVWFTRWFWKKVRWVPLRDEVFGAACSTFVDTVMYRARWDLFPDEWDSYSVPGQFASLAGWSAENNLLGTASHVDQNYTDETVLRGEK